ncbi:geranylgeranyl reductase family protein [Planomonospora sp. ID82291]|uniref:geranylgeranyl reductase family protein n=1 Tax=Planomonospora sp. ID82291 TaxID=2738136 RepID=UPI0018C43B7C|nr:geranylgeranyl reductase family protein [Planomonospora sp. ID82291]MBG0813947.1 geranylgeranyl reductase family protein [Planomonospora sp. ID82291]
MTVPATPPRSVAEADADVIVVGAGPAGSTTAFHLAQAGLDVLLLEKTSFPREKVCGDGLTPRAVKQLIAMGIDIDAPGWVRNKGLRVVGGGLRFELDWPELSSYPDFGLVRTRQDFDEILAATAVRAGARLLEGVNVTAPILDDRSGHIVGVTAKKDGEEVAYRSRLVVAADGNSTRISLAMGLHKREDRPMGVAVRTYFTSPRHDDDYLETWLELWDGDQLLPGYGWIFGVGDGTSNVGLGLLSTSESFRGMDYRDLLRRWTKNMPPEWGFTEENMTTPIRGAALPMAFNRQPHYTRGLVLVGDAGGMINPFNGEGIAYAMETGRIAAETVVQALGRGTAAQRERVLRAYPQVLKDAYGGYFTLGRGFVELISRRGVMDFATRHAFPHPRLMRFALKLLANLTDRRGDASDRIINALSKVAPPA